MADIAQSVQAYEAWLRAELREELVEKDLVRKHEKMRGSPFAFLRASYWRWAETVVQICPAFKSFTNRMRSAAVRSGKSSHSSAGDLPPSSSVTGVRLAAAALITRRPVSLEPVNSR